MSPDAAAAGVALAPAEATLAPGEVLPVAVAYRPAGGWAGAAGSLVLHTGVGRFTIPVVAGGARGAGDADGGVPLVPDPGVPGGRVLVLPLENAGDAAGYAACSCAAPAVVEPAEGVPRVVVVTGDEGGRRAAGGGPAARALQAAREERVELTVERRMRPKASPARSDGTVTLVAWRVHLRDCARG